MTNKPVRIGVIGLGYVGLPLAVSFAGQYDVVGFDIDKTRIDELKNGHDRTNEVDPEQLQTVQRAKFTADPRRLQEANVYIVTAPTPIDEFKKPNLLPLLTATRTVSSVLKSGDVVIFESTVFPGATEDECVPILEHGSGLNLNDGFSVGYSPERINPGDKKHTFENILKVTSGSNDQTAQFVGDLYASVVKAGTYAAPSIKVAEAAKVIENTQRDLNIALINELALVFDRLGIETQEVLEAARTKWNFLPFEPGLVGGHCIGVDPYYLTHKAKAVDYIPDLILAGRRVNDSIGSYVASKLIKMMVARKIDMRSARVLIMGLTFKENTSDIRNTRVIDVYNDLVSYGLNVDVYDPWVDPKVALDEFDITLLDSLTPATYDGIVLAVGHDVFRSLGGAGIRRFAKGEGQVLFDIKSVLASRDSDIRL